MVPLSAKPSHSLQAPTFMKFQIYSPNIWRACRTATHHKVPLFTPTVSMKMEQLTLQNCHQNVTENGENFSDWLMVLPLIH